MAPEKITKNARIPSKSSVGILLGVTSHMPRLIDILTTQRPSNETSQRAVPTRVVQKTERDKQISCFAYRYAMTSIFLRQIFLIWYVTIPSPGERKNEGRMTGTFRGVLLHPTRRWAVRRTFRGMFRLYRLFLRPRAARTVEKRSPFEYYLNSVRPIPIRARRYYRNFSFPLSKRTATRNCRSGIVVRRQCGRHRSSS